MERRTRHAFLLCGTHRGDPIFAHHNSGANLDRSSDMTNITVCHLEVWDSVNDQMVRSKRIGTPDAIKNTAHGREVGQGIDVDAADVGPEIAGFTMRNYRPPGSSNPGVTR